jgi:hypothetical protein
MLPVHRADPIIDRTDNFTMRRHTLISGMLCNFDQAKTLDIRWKLSLREIRRVKAR